MARLQYSVFYRGCVKERQKSFNTYKLCSVLGTSVTFVGQNECTRMESLEQNDICITLSEEVKLERTFKVCTLSPG
jgi:hypothetical protein